MIRAMEPWSPYSWTVGAKRTLIERTLPSASARRSLTVRPPAPGNGSGKSFSVASAPGLQSGDARGDCQRSAAARQRVAERLDRNQVATDGDVKVTGEGDVATESVVDDAVAIGSRIAQHVALIDVVASDLHGRR